MASDDELRMRLRGLRTPPPAEDTERELATVLWAGRSRERRRRASVAVAGAAAAAVAVLLAVWMTSPVEEGEVIGPPDEGEGDEAVCLEGERFVEDGGLFLPHRAVSTVDDEDRREVSDLRWEEHEGCERLVIDVAREDGEPADDVGIVSAAVLREHGVVRVRLPDVTTVDPDATETAVAGTLTSAAYVVRAEEGRSVEVDVHLADAAEASVSVLEEPGRVVVDLRPGGSPVPGPPATDDLVVVLEPRPGGAGYPLTVAGYARTFEANVVVRIEQDGEQVEETFTTATSWAGTWGQFSLTIDDGPSGPIELHVGEYSAKDGSWEGTVVELDMR